MTALRRVKWEELPASLVDALAPRVKRLGYFGEFFACGAHQPEALLAFIALTESAKAELPKNLVEVIALTCASTLGNEYERHQHEQLCLKLGLQRDWVQAVNQLRPEDADALSAQERKLQRFVMTALSSHGKAAGPLFEDVVADLGDAGAVAVLMVIGRYVMHALIVNTLGLAPPVPSIFVAEAAS